MLFTKQIKEVTKVMNTTVQKDWFSPHQLQMSDKQEVIAAGHLITNLEKVMMEAHKATKWTDYQQEPLKMLLKNKHAKLLIINNKMNIWVAGREVKDREDTGIKATAQLTILKDLWINTSLIIQFNIGAEAVLRARDVMNHRIKDKKAMATF